MNKLFNCVALAFLLAGSLLAVGCAANEQGLKQSQNAYDKGDYAAAYIHSKTIADDSAQPTAQRQQAAYFAGLSALKLNKVNDAAEYFGQAAESTEPSLSADASAQLGGVYAFQGNFNLAASEFLKASEKMTGEDKARALFYAGVAQQKMGRLPQAATNLRLAQSTTTDPTFKKTIGEQMLVTGFTIQTGAFSDEATAKKEAAIVGAKGTPLKHTTRVVPATDPKSGKKLYLVQVGNFISQPTAMQALESMKLNNALVVPLSDAK
jgi:tetratricopeptide (TPR) repeat protein